MTATMRAGPTGFRRSGFRLGQSSQLLEQGIPVTGSGLFEGSGDHKASSGCLGRKHFSRIDPVGFTPEQNLADRVAANVFFDANQRGGIDAHF